MQKQKTYIKHEELMALKDDVMVTWAGNENTAIVM